MLAINKNQVAAVNNKKMRNPLDILVNKITLETGLKKNSCKQNRYILNRRGEVGI
jgi:hypothetical protein